MSLDRDLANFFWLGLGGSKKRAVEVDPARISLAVGAVPPSFERNFAEAVDRGLQKQVE